MNEHLTQDTFAGLAMLEMSDPERLKAQRHLDGCDECKVAMAEAEQVLAKMDLLSLPPPPSKGALQRAQAAVLAQLEAERGRDALPTESRVPEESPMWVVMALPVLTVLSFAIAVLIGERLGLIVDEVPWVLGMGVGAVIAMRSALGMVRGKERDQRVALGMVFAMSLVLAILDQHGEGEGHGLRCVGIEMAVAIVPSLLAAYLGWRGVLPRLGAAGLASAASAAALAGQIALRALCADRHLTHLLLFHVGGVIAAALIGATVSRWITAREG